MKLLALVLFVCVANAYSAAVSKDEIDSIPQPDLLDALDRGYDDDPQPAEEKLTPANGKFEGDILLTPEEEKAINDADKNIPQLRSDDDNSNDPQPAEETLTPADDKFEGDILLTPEEEKAINDADKNLGKRGGGLRASLNFRWPDNKVYYILHSALSSLAKSVIQQAMADWEKYTCTRFIQGKSPKGHYIHIFPGRGCYSYLGYIKRAGQSLSIGKGCEWKGTVIHELAHAQGILHEQSRTDRDQYVSIQWNNIISGMERNFKKHAYAQTAGVPYDYDSIMHYGSLYFSKNRQPTIITKNGASIGKRAGFSPIDIKFANAFLKCSQQPAPTTPEPSVSKAPTPKPSVSKDIWSADTCSRVKKLADLSKILCN